MNKLILFSLAVISIIWVGCSQSADVKAMLNNAEAKDKVFSAIMDDHELMTEFMDKMMSNNHAMMMQDNNMMNMMKEKPDMMHNMMSEMMKDGEMIGHMMQMMKQEGLMSEECMQSCMKMMGDKGMSMDMDMKNDKNTGNKEEENHDSHH